MGKEDGRTVDFDVADFKPPVSKLSRAWMYVLVILTAYVALLTGYFIVVHLLPFEPYAIHDIRPEVSEVCPGETVKVYVDRTVDDSIPIYNIDVFGYWVGDDEARIGDVSASGRESDGEYESAAFRMPPTQEGYWYPSVDIEVNGTVFGWDRTQYLQMTGDKPIYVLSENECGKGG